MCGCSRLVLAGGGALSPSTCVRRQQPQDPPSPRCLLDKGTHSLGLNTARAASIQHPENMFRWKSLQIQSVSLKTTKLPAFLSSPRGMQAKEKTPPFPVSNRKAIECSAQSGFCMQGGRRQAVPWTPGPSAREAPAHRPLASHCPHDPPMSSTREAGDGLEGPRLREARATGLPLELAKPSCASGPCRQQPALDTRPA